MTGACLVSRIEREPWYQIKTSYSKMYENHRPI